MKKFMRIALVFALAGATLVGCTKDYSGDISDLNKKVSEQQAAVTALQSAVSNAQSAADAAASTASTALSTAKAAATADELNAVKAELAKAATADALTAVDAKYAAYIPAIEAAAKAADLEAFKTLVTEEIAKLATKDEVAAFKAAYDEMVAALEAADKENDGKIAELKTACDTKFAALDAADKKNAEAIVALQDALTNAIEEAKAADEKNAEGLKALEEVVSTAIAATNVSIEDIKAALAAHKTEFDAAVERILALETNYIELEARVLALEEADEEIRALIAENKAGIEANAEDIEALQKKVEELLAQAYTELTTISAPASAVQVNFDYAVYNPTTQNSTKETKAAYKALAEEFPEITEIKEKTGYVQGGHVPFVVNPASVQFDENDTFTFVNVKGQEYPGTLSNPVEGFEGIESVAKGQMTTKSSEYGYWTLTLAPTWDAKTGFKSEDGLSLVVTDGENVATTPFVYEVKAKTIGADDDIDIKMNTVINYAPEIDLLDKVAVVVDENSKQKPAEALSFENEMTGKFILEAATDEEHLDNSVAIEKYGISFDGSKVLIAKYPDGEKNIKFSVAVTALGLNGSAVREHFVLTVSKAISADGVLAAKEVVLKGTANAAKPYMIRWNLADYDFSRAELKEFITAGSHTFAYDYKYVENNTEKHIKGTKNVYFYDSQKRQLTDLNNDWSKAVTFGFNITSDGEFAPREYDVLFTVSDVAGQTTIYAAESTFTVTNDEEVTGAAIKLLDSVCDENGVLLAVGTPDDFDIVYEIDKAITIEDTDVVSVTSFKDLEWNKDADESVDNYNWISERTITIPSNLRTDDDDEYYYFVNNTVRNLRANLQFFGNANNTGVFDFQAKVISPVYSAKVADVITVANQTIYFSGEEKKPTSVKIDEFITEAVFAAGNDATKSYAPFVTWSEKLNPEKDVINYNSSFANFAVVGTDPQVIKEEDKAGVIAGLLNLIPAPANYNWGTPNPNHNTPQMGDNTQTRTATYIPATVKGTVTVNGTTYYDVTLSGVSRAYTQTRGWTFSQQGPVWNNWNDSDITAGAWNTENAVLTISDRPIEWLVDATGEFVTVKTSNVFVLQGFGITGGDIASLAGKAFNVTRTMLDNAYNIWGQYYDASGAKQTGVTDVDSKCAAFELVKAHASKVVKKAGADGSAITRNEAWEHIYDVTVVFDDVKKASKFLTVNGEEIDADGYDALYPGYYTGALTNPTWVIEAKQNYSVADLPGNQVTLGAKFYITDDWGMTMEVPFTVTCKINPAK